MFSQATVPLVAQLPLMLKLLRYLVGEKLSASRKVVVMQEILILMSLGKLLSTAKIHPLSRKNLDLPKQQFKI